MYNALDAFLQVFMVLFIDARDCFQVEEHMLGNDDRWPVCQAAGCQNTCLETIAFSTLFQSSARVAALSVIISIDGRNFGSG